MRTDRATLRRGSSISDAKSRPCGRPPYANTHSTVAVVVSTSGGSCCAKASDACAELPLRWTTAPSETTARRVMISITVPRLQKKAASRTPTACTAYISATRPTAQRVFGGSAIAVAPDPCSMPTISTR